MKQINVEELQSLRNEGKSYREIAAMLGCTKSTVSKYCGGDTLSLRCKSKLANVDTDMPDIEKYLQEHTYDETAEKFGMGRSTLIKYCKKRSFKKITERKPDIPVTYKTIVNDISDNSNYHDTKMVGDISEQTVILEAMIQGISVMRPIGDRLSYDMVFDVMGCLIKIQVKTAWYDKTSGYVFDMRKKLTNSRHIKVKRYGFGDFDFIIIYVPDKKIFYIFTFEHATQYRGKITLRKHDNCINDWNKIKEHAEKILNDK